MFASEQLNPFQYVMLRPVDATALLHEVKQHIGAQDEPWAMMIPFDLYGMLVGFDWDEHGALTVRWLHNDYQYVGRLHTFLAYVLRKFW